MTQQSEHLEDPHAIGSLCALDPHCALRGDVIPCPHHVSTPPAQGEWQPIETAPRDGTRVLLSWDGTRVGYYLNNSTSSRPWEGWQVPSLEPWPKGQPIAWMPMPAPALAAPQPAPELWCMHVLGPDDVHPAPSKAAAEAAAERFNAHFGPIAAEKEVMCKAVVALWPHSPESHAASLAEWSQWEQPAPAPVQAACRCLECGAEAGEPCAEECTHPPAPAADDAENHVFHLTNIRDQVSQDGLADSDYQVGAIDAAIAALAQQRVPDAVRELPGIWCERTPRHADARSAYTQCAAELRSALATIDQQQEARGNGE